MIVAPSYWLMILAPSYWLLTPLIPNCIWLLLVAAALLSCPDPFAAVGHLSIQLSHRNRDKSQVFIIFLILETLTPDPTAAFHVNTRQ